MRSRLRRCSTSSLLNGMRPLRTSSMPGWYSSRQASAKASQSMAWPSGLRRISASRAMLVRQSTSVPKTSKNSARGVTTACAQSGPGRDHAFFLHHRNGSGAAEAADERLDGISTAGIDPNPGRIGRIVLDFRRKRSNERNALDRKDFADLVNAYLGLAVGDMLGHGAAMDQHGLWLDVRGEAKPVQQTGDVDAAGAAGLRIDVGD